MSPWMRKATGRAALAAVACGFASWLHQEWWEVIAVYIAVYVGLTLLDTPVANREKGD